MAFRSTVTSSNQPIPLFITSPTHSGPYNKESYVRAGRGAKITISQTKQGKLPKKKEEQKEQIEYNQLKFDS